MSWLVWVIASIVLHELGHGFAAIWEGDDTPREMGHITLNPVVHMGWFSLIALAIMGIAWGLMPVNPSRFRNGRRGWAFVAAAGPAVNLLLSALCIVGCALAIRYGPQSEPIATNLRMFLVTGAWLNLYLMAFNLMPVPPLDGAVILSGFSESARRFFSKPGVQQFGLLVLVIAVFSTDLASHLVKEIQTLTIWAVGATVELLPPS
ncbi:MAG: site-2 protease family protein [Phycisphaerales bacterium]|nr:site-2 protease family protein [Phycisphaerales bacterium]